MKSLSYVLLLYTQRSNKTYSQSRLIQPAQATRAQNPASSNMAAQALCEHAPKDATKLIDNFKSGFLSAMSRHEISGICALNDLAPITFSAMEYLGS
jgi:hypothetical protein